MYNGAVCTIAGECCCDDVGDEEFDGGIGSVWKTGDNGYSKLSDRDDRAEWSSSPGRKTLFSEGRGYDDGNTGENDGVLSLDVDDKAAVGVVKPPDELSINGE